MSSRYHKLLIFDVKSITKINDMSPFNFFIWEVEIMCLFSYKHTQTLVLNILVHGGVSEKCCSGLISSKGVSYLRFRTC